MGHRAEVRAALGKVRPPTTLPPPRPAGSALPACLRYGSFRGTPSLAPTGPTCPLGLDCPEIGPALKPSLSFAAWASPALPCPGATGTGRSFKLPDELDEWSSWVAANPGRDTGWWMLKNNKQAGRGGAGARQGPGRGARGAGQVVLDFRVCLQFMCVRKVGKRAIPSICACIQKLRGKKAAAVQSSASPNP